LSNFKAAANHLRGRRGRQIFQTSCAAANFKHVWQLQTSNAPVRQLEI